MLAGGLVTDVAAGVSSCLDLSDMALRTAVDGRYGLKREAVAFTKAGLFGVGDVTR
jgi:hypothetical protein